MLRQIRRLKQIKENRVKQAGEIGVNPTSLYDWLKGETQPSKASLEKIDRYLRERLEKASPKTSAHYKGTMQYAKSQEMADETINKVAANICYNEASYIEKSVFEKILDWFRGVK